MVMVLSQAPYFLDLPAPPRPPIVGLYKHSIRLIHPTKESAQVFLRGLEFTLDDLFILDDLFHFILFFLAKVCYFWTKKLGKFWIILFFQCKNLLYLWKTAPNIGYPKIKKSKEKKRKNHGPDVTYGNESLINTTLSFLLLLLLLLLTRQKCLPNNRTFYL